jgi:hypothetical protein
MPAQRHEAKVVVRVGLVVVIHDDEARVIAQPFACEGDTICFDNSRLRPRSGSTSLSSRRNSRATRAPITAKA